MLSIIKINNIPYLYLPALIIYNQLMKLEELRDKLNKKHVKLKVPKIYGESYAVQYARLLKDWTDNIVENFSSLVTAIFELQAVKPEQVIVEDSSFDEWDNFFKEHESDIADIERQLYGRKKRKSPDESKRAWKELLGIITLEIDAKYPKKKKEPADYTSSLSSLFDYYTGRAELLARDWTDKELNNLYRYVYGSYKSSFPNMSVSGEYYEQIMNAVINENLTLIKSIPQEVLKDMQVALSQGIISGNQKELIKNLKRIKGVSKDRAVFIARDQIHKAVESFKQVQNTALGIEYYEWLTADDERVSSGIGGHAQNNHRIFKYGSNEAIISHSAKRGFYYGKPGDRPNCRCIAVGVILDTDEKIIKSPDGYGYKVVKK